MKTFIQMCFGTILAGFFLLSQPIHAFAQAGDEVSFQEFYDELEPYGQWIDDPQYGYVWRPDAGNDFRPYQTNGHWTMTEYGNMWVSDYDWGWAPFHYGRWTLNPSYGWLWIPGTQWGPAWVDWRQGGGYYGWAPLGPGINININFGRRNYAPDAWWCFVPQRYVLSRGFYNYRVPYGRNVTIINNTTIINNNYVRNNVRYVSGPRVGDIQRVTRERVNIYRVGNTGRPGVTQINNNTVNVYRPDVRRTGNDNNRPAPERVVRNGEPVTNNRSSGERISRNREDRTGVVRPDANNTGGRTRGEQSGIDRSSSNRDNNRNRPERIMRGDDNGQAADRQRVERSQQMQQRNEQQQVERQQRSQQQQVERQQQMQQRSQKQQVQREQQMQQRNQQMQVERQQRSQQQQIERQQQMQQRSQQQQMERQQRGQQQQMQRQERQQQQQARPERVERSRRG